LMEIIFMLLAVIVGAINYMMIARTALK